MKRLIPVRAPAVTLVLGAIAVGALVGAVSGCGGDGGSAPATEGPTTVFGRQARDLAVGVTAKRLGEKVGVTATVLGQDGTGVRHLRVELASGGAGWVPADPCGSGRYCGEVTTAASPRLRVRLTRPGGHTSTVVVTLPPRPDPVRARALVRTATIALRRLHSVVVNESLGSGPESPPLFTQFVYVAPDRLRYSTSGAGAAIVISGRRWDRERPTSAWLESAQYPLDVPATDWERVLDPSILASGTRKGRAVWRVSFYDPTTPSWFEADLDKKTGLPLWVSMTAAAHFMTHTFGAFNAPVDILPPASA